MSIVRDTSTRARAIHLQALRALDGATRLSMALRMSQTAMRLTAAGIRHRNPRLSDVEVQQALVKLLIGDEDEHRHRTPA